MPKRTCGTCTFASNTGHDLRCGRWGGKPVSEKAPACNAHRTDEERAAETKGFRPMLKVSVEEGRVEVDKRERVLAAVAHREAPRGPRRAEPMGHKHITPEEKKEMQARRDRGERICDIAEAMGVSEVSVSRHTYDPKGDRPVRKQRSARISRLEFPKDAGDCGQCLHEPICPHKDRLEDVKDVAVCRHWCRLAG